MTSRFEILTGISSTLAGCWRWATQQGEETVTFRTNHVLALKNIPWDFNVFAPRNSVWLDRRWSRKVIISQGLLPDTSPLAASSSAQMLLHPAKFGDQLESPMGIVCEPTNAVLENKVVSETPGIMSIPNIYLYPKRTRIPGFKKSYTVFVDTLINISHTLYLTLPG